MKAWKATSDGGRVAMRGEDAVRDGTFLFRDH